MKRNAPTRPQVLARIDTLIAKGVTAKAILVAAGLGSQPAFISKARAGGCAGSKAAESWAKLVAALDEFEKTPGQKLASAVEAAAAPSPSALGKNANQELSGEILASSTHEKLHAVAQKIGSLIALGADLDFVALNNNVAHQRKCLDSKLKELEVAKLGEPLRVEVVYARAAGAPPHWWEPTPTPEPAVDAEVKP